MVNVAVPSDTAPSLQTFPCHLWKRVVRIELNRPFQMEEAFNDHTDQLRGHFRDDENVGHCPTVGITLAGLGYHPAL